MRFPRLLLAFLLLMAMVGCQQSTSSRLVGAWQGRPDTAAAAAARSQKLKEQQRQAKGGVQKSPESDETTGGEQEIDGVEATDLEQYDVEVVLDFQSDQKVNMQLIGDDKPLIGVWRVVTSLPPHGAEIEIGLWDAGEESMSEKRRFLIEFQQNGGDPGFTLREKGADPKFGRLYFTKH